MKQKQRVVAVMMAVVMMLGGLFLQELDASAADDMGISLQVDWSKNLDNQTPGSMDMNEPTNIIEHDDYIYMNVSGVLKKMVKSNGTVAAISSNDVLNGYNYFLSQGEVNGNFAILAQQQIYDSVTYTMTMQVMAFDENCHLLWTSPSVTGYSGAYSKLVYDATQHLIYGSYNEQTSSFFALHAEDGSVAWSKDISSGATINGSGYSYQSYGGYWAGAVTVGDYVVFPSEGANLFVYRATDGTFIDTKSVGSTTSACIRCSIIYKDGFLFYTSNDGYVHKTAIDLTTGKLGEDIAQKISSDVINSTSTPAVYQGRVYVTGESLQQSGTPAVDKGVLTVLDEQDMSVISTNYIEGSGKIYDVVMDENHSNSKVVYGYASYQSKPGSFIYFQNDLTTEKDCTIKDASNLTQSLSENYCATQLSLTSDDHIYITNDNGILIRLTPDYSAVKEENNTVTTDIKTSSTQTTTSQAVTSQAEVSPKTGESTSIFWLVFLMAGSLTIFGGYEMIKRKKG